MSEQKNTQDHSLSLDKELTVHIIDDNHQAQDDPFGLSTLHTPNEPNFDTPDHHTPEPTNAGIDLQFLNQLGEDDEPATTNNFGANYQSFQIHHTFEQDTNASAHTEATNNRPEMNAFESAYQTTNNDDFNFGAVPLEKIPSATDSAFGTDDERLLNNDNKEAPTLDDNTNAHAKTNSDEVVAAAMPTDNSKKSKKSPSKTLGGGLFKRQQPPKEKPTPTKNTKNKASGSIFNNSKKLNMLIIAGIILLALVAGALYMMSQEQTAEPTPAPAPSQAKPPVDSTAPTSVAEVASPSSSASEADILPKVGTTSVNPDEILNAQIPEDPALIKEEIDHLADTEKQLNEQGKVTKEQLAILEELTTAKAEQIALLEAQIAEIEKKKNSTASPATSSAQNTQ